ncbi:hypothetical protein FO675_00065 [Riemerella anatipestifer]|uniref:RHS repeat-associated core domain-containing protein n=1 Tax=Riemerella anatipestifer TaxID=34085 RepID=UPI001AD6E21A|nr:RHS repeat-associated core domain-containing protein [Riemerella anatipestifer]MBO4232714.1 hypothetical protein [Riemerella anatipestifer]
MVNSLNLFCSKMWREFVLAIDKESNYYPFGLEHTGYNGLLGNQSYNYKYNGKELQTEIGMYAMDWRQYMSDIGRFTGMDKLSSMSSDLSPYRFGFNNPVMFADPSGLYEEIPGGYRITSPNEIRTFMGYLQNNSGVSFDTMRGHITGSGLYQLEQYTNLNEVVMQGKGKDFNSNYAYNSEVLYSGINNAIESWNLSQAKSTLYSAYQNTKIGQEIGAFERFLFMELPLNITGGELLSMGWRAVGAGKYLSSVINNTYARIAPKIIPQVYTKSLLALGREMHAAYKVGENGFKEFRLPSGKRIDFLDITNQTIYELKPFNPRAMKAGEKQLQIYMQELQTIPRFQGINWKTVLETY